MTSWWRRLRHLYDRQQFDADLAEELAFHHECARQDLEQAGHGPAEAARAAHLRLGNHALTSDQARDVWLPVDLRDLSYDIRSAVRVSLKDLWFTAVVVGTLALAIGFNATLYTIVIGMGGTFPVADPARVVTLASLDPNGRQIGVSYLDLEDWRVLSTMFDTIAAYSTAAMTMTDRGLAAERVSGAYISAATFTIIGQRPMLGRDFRAEDDRAGAARVVILAASVWKHRYGSDAGIVGRVITVNGVPLTVVGVMPEGFRFPLVDLHSNR